MAELGTFVSDVLIQKSSQYLLFVHHNSNLHAFQSERSKIYDFHLFFRALPDYAQRGIRRLWTKEI